MLLINIDVVGWIWQRRVDCHDSTNHWYNWSDHYSEMEAIMLTIKSEPAYSVTITVDIDGQERTVTALDLSPSEADHFEAFLNKEALTPFLEYRFKRAFCESLVDIQLRQAQDAQLVKEHIAGSLIPGYPEIEDFNFGSHFNKTFLEVADNLQNDGLVKIYRDFNSKNIRMIEPTKVGHYLFNLLFGK